ncbi:MAG TPA: GNAT family N-acetyltransferase [Vicinamibacterales bacterium]|nr:GNAT family N-acetyltransferase [Vicinamibacterales bacterium]
MKLRDWRDAPYELLAPVYEAERQRWLRHLQWDPAPVWREVEAARTTWGLPGLLAIDGAGRVRGTTFYVFEEHRVDIGGLTADHVDATDALIGGVLDAARSQQARSVRTMLFDGAVALRSGLTHRGFEVESHLYLSRALAERPIAPAGDQVRASAPAVAADAWQESDVVATAALLSRAYDRQSGALFAPDNLPEEWERYVRNLTGFAACGTLNSDASRVVRDRDLIRAVALVTEIAPRIAHLVQLAVDPALRRRQVGARLLDDTCACLAASGYKAITLLVSEHNHAARALYDAAGFRHDATFLAATFGCGG